MKRKAGIKAKGGTKTKSEPAKSRTKTVIQAKNAKATTAKAKAAEAKPAKAKPTKAKPAGAPDIFDALVTAGTTALKLPLEPAWHAGVKFNLQLILRMGALVDEFALPDDAEPAPVFYA
jgi:cell division septation protein DedD